MSICKTIMFTLIKVVAYDIIVVVYLDKHHQTAVVSVMYLTGVGFVITFFGILLAGDFNIDDGITLLFAGGLISTVFWVCCSSTMTLKQSYYILFWLFVLYV